MSGTRCLRWSMKSAMVLSLLVLVPCFIPGTAAADVWHNGYFLPDGTYIEGHWRADADNERWNDHGKRGKPHNERWNDRGKRGERRVDRIPSFFWDHDGDGIYNRFDLDDDNDGIPDYFDDFPWNRKLR